MINQSCSNCRFFSALKTTCRFNPPIGQLLIGPNGQTQAIGFQTPTSAGDWCGKWEEDLNRKEIEN